MPDKVNGYYARKLAYIRKFNKEKYVTFCLKVNKETEADILDKIYSKDNKQGYIKSLIQKDIEEGN